MDNFKRGSDPSSVLEIGRSTPSDYCKTPIGSRFQKSEAETIITNIMIILKRTGNKWRHLDWSEYKMERIKDGNFCTNHEKEYFELVNRYCFSAKNARLVSRNWTEIYNKFNKK